jgi:Cu2+-containing amine oxidase
MGAACLSAAPHPLAPLTADEIRQAARLFRESSRFPASGIFSLIALDEPPKWCWRKQPFHGALSR